MKNQSYPSFKRLCSTDRSILNYKVEGILALGAEQKNSFCIGKDSQAIMSQYIGDLKNIPDLRFLTRNHWNGFFGLFRFKPEYIACDLHPDYFSTQYAAVLEKTYNIPVVKVQHHHAHIVSCMAEHGLDEKVIGISMDGTGYGTDGRILGQENSLLLIADGFQQIHPFRLYSYARRRQSCGRTLEDGFFISV